MTDKIFINAMNVHQGGGKSLLEALLKSLHDDAEFILLLDNRMSITWNLAENIQVKRVMPSVLHRLEAEKWLVNAVEKDSLIICFGNLPPLFRLRGHTVVFLQNRYLVENISLKGFSLKVHLRLTIERMWLSHKMRNVDEFVVQTSTMKKLLESKMQGPIPVRVLPFVAEPSGHVRILPQLQLKTHKESVFDFVYVASGETHKNHRRLIEAWCLLADDGLFPSLCLTFEEIRFSGLCRLIDEMRQLHGIKVNNVGGLSHHHVLALYKKSAAMIYPSTFESFGLPLIEARQAGMPVLASELDYVRDVLDPEQTFDPDSPLSIARAVKRFMGVNEQSLPLLDGSQFVASVFKKDRQ